jgi:hypothetical protein
MFFIWADSVAHRGVLHKKSVKCVDSAIYHRKSRNEMQSINPMTQMIPIGTSIKEAEIFEKEFQNWRVSKKYEDTENRRKQYSNLKKSTFLGNTLTTSLFKHGTSFHDEIKPAQKTLPLVVYASSKLTGWTQDDVKNVLMPACGMRKSSLLKSSGLMDQSMNGGDVKHFHKNIELILNTFVPASKVSEIDRQILKINSIFL